MKPKRVEIWFADLGIVAKPRPVLVVSWKDPDPTRDLLTYHPLTPHNRGSAYEVPLGHLPFLHKDSVANVQGIGALPSVRFERKVGALSDTDMASIEAAILYSLGITPH